MHQQPDEVSTVVLDWGTIKWMVTPDLQEDAGLTVGEVIVYPGTGHAPHRHPGAEEVIYVISGEGEQTIGDEGPFPIREGQAFHIPRDVVHSTLNTTWRPLRLVVVYTPGGEEHALEALPDFRRIPPGVAPAWVPAAP